MLEVLKVDQTFSAWASQGFDGEYETMVASEWTKEDFDRAVTQITGRAFGESCLDLKDVHVVLLRMGLCKTVNQTKKSKEGSSDDSGKKDAIRETTLDTNPESWSERLKRIESDANSFEQELISCVVNPGKSQMYRI